MKAEIQPKAIHSLNMAPSIKPTRVLTRESMAPQSVSPESAARLGHHFGAIRIQPKLTIGPVNDQYEQEADRVATQVVSQVNSPVEPGQPLRRMGEEEDEELLQGKRMADSIQRQDELEEEDELLQGKRLTDTVQRMGEVEEEDELQLKSLLQRRSDGAADASPELEESIQQARGGGQALSDNVRLPMENAFGANFSRVKVHTDTRADHLNQSIQARAFTTGQDIFMRQGEFSTGSRSGQELLAHELTHVVQQNQEVIN